MKKLLPVLFILLTVNVAAQNKDYLISTDGLGAIKLGMSQAELEKLIAKKIPLTNPDDTISGAWYDSAKIRYKNIDVEVNFQRRYVTNDSFYMTVRWIGAKSPLCKTASGIGIGSDKLKIISAFNGYYMDIMPVYFNEGKEKSKTMSTISVREDVEGYTILFNLVNKKVVSFEIFPVYDDEE